MLSSSKRNRRSSDERLSDCKLIELVKRYPVLYEGKYATNKGVCALRKACWEKIGEELQRTPGMYDTLYIACYHSLAYAMTYLRVCLESIDRGSYLG